MDTESDKSIVYIVATEGYYGTCYLKGDDPNGPRVFATLEQARAFCADYIAATNQGTDVVIWGHNLLTGDFLGGFDIE